MSAVPLGYKQSELGIIPKDWIVATASALCDLVVDCKNRTPPVIEGDEFAVVRTPNVRDGKFVRDELRFTDEQSFQEWTARAVPQTGDILITREAPLGEVCLVPDDLRVCLGQRMMLYRPNNEITDSNFLLFALLSSRVQKNLHSKIGGSTVGHAKVDDIRFLQIPCPPTLPEQRAIAATLSDVDALLAKLDQFIAKKRDLKQAAMQQLLTGQTRLPGFSGEWEVVPLPDMSWFQEGPGVRTHQFRLSGVKLLNGTNISNGRLLLDSTIRYVSNDEAEGAYKHFLVDEGDILLATSGVTIEKLHEKVAVVKHEDIPLCMNTSTVRFKVSNTRLIASYLYLFLRSDVFKKQIGRQATGSAQLNFGPSHLKKVDIPLPPSLPEQTAIATVLSDMDAELAALEAHRDKTRALKQGMMHELLTGRIRLI